MNGPLIDYVLGIWVGICLLGVIGGLAKGSDTQRGVSWIVAVIALAVLTLLVVTQ